MSKEIKFLENYGGEATKGVLHQVGETAEVADDAAARLVGDGRAVYVETEPEPEAAEEKPKRGRPKKSE